eukprot:421459-Pleurochrysis_carterae.AAC.1
MGEKGEGVMGERETGDGREKGRVVTALCVCVGGGRPMRKKISLMLRNSSKEGNGKSRRRTWACGRAHEREDRGVTTNKITPK